MVSLSTQDELLLAGAEHIARRQRTAGVRCGCDLHLWLGQVHDLPLAADVLLERRRAIGQFD